MKIQYRDKLERVGYVWQPALHYGIAYTGFALITRALRYDIYQSAYVFISGFSYGCGVFLFIVLRRADARRSLYNGPAFQWSIPSLISGIAASAIVIATVSAFLFEGVSILLALVLMRLGVLLLAFVIDFLSPREVSRRAIISGALCLSGCAIGAVWGTFSPLSPTVFFVLAMYLSGYAIRLSLMSRYVKTTDRAARGNWFMAELRVLIIVLCAALLMSGLILNRILIENVSLLFASSLAGLAYGYAFSNGTLIYLDWRENIRAVTINRAVSLISGVVASLIGWHILRMPIPIMREWVLAAFMIIALLIMALDSKTIRRA